jgi:hypothetical protein
VSADAKLRAPLPRPDHAYALSAEEIERFVEEGVLFLEGCFTREAADELVRATLDDRSPAPRLGRKESELVDVGDIDLRDRTTWGVRDRLEVSTGRSLVIERFAPRLWGAIQSLIGAGRPIARKTMGEQWLVKGRFRDESERPSFDSKYFLRFRWHIDTPGERTTLEGRRDALVLLILWSDVEPSAGGTLYSGQSLDHVVRLLEDHPEGIDTRRDFGAPIVRAVTDAREVVGRAGDVLITHPFALHSAQNNYAEGLRILENPTITVPEPLRYYTDAEEPSPVERAVIRRLARPRPRPRHFSEDAARYLIEHHADYFLPGRAAWNERVSAEEREIVYALDRGLARHWATETVAKVRQSDPLRALDAAIAEVRELLVNQRAIRASLHEAVSDADFSSTAFSRLLRGLVSCEGQNHLLGLVLSRIFEEVYCFDAIDPATKRSPHALVWVRSERGCFFADAWASHTVFHLRGCHGEPYPGTPEYDDLDLGDAVKQGAMYPRAVYEHGLAVGGKLELPAECPPEVLDHARARLGAGATSAWQAYLGVRAKHVFGTSRDLGAAYAALTVEHRFAGTTRELISILEKRVTRGLRP